VGSYGKLLSDFLKPDLTGEIPVRWDRNFSMQVFLALSGDETGIAEQPALGIKFTKFFN
jgi:hypothetical protein